MAYFSILRFVFLSVALAVISSPVRANSSLWANGIPQPAFDKVNELVGAGHAVKKVSFVPGGGWVILYDHNGYWAQSIPADA